MSCRFDRQARRGFTLTEIAIVMGVIGLILGAIWVAASQVRNSNKTELAVQETFQILNNYRTLFAQHPVDTGATPYDITCEGVQAGYFPGNMGGSGCVSATYTTYPSSPWGSAAGGQSVIVYGVQATNSIEIQFNGLTQAACVSLASQILTAPDITGAKIISSAGTATLTIPATIAQITGDCAANATNQIVATYPAQ